MEEIRFEKIPKGIYDNVKTNKEEFVEKFIDELEEFFPETVKDGKVDFQALLERFGEYQDRNERYELTWVGKDKARQESFEDIVGKTLKYIEEDSKNPETTENLYIEGDNLEVLKLLRKSYYGKIKMIYIDPPYNTGNDFVYKDDFTMPKEEYDKLKGDIDEYGERLVKNSADSGRYHSNWLNMMYPRLQVARDLLTDDGVIFISIDDNEVHNLRKICDEIFGEGNFIANILWQKRTSPDARKVISNGHEHILLYVKNSTTIDKALNYLSLEESDSSGYQNPDNDPRGPWRSTDFGAQGFRPNQMYKITSPSGREHYPSEGRCWKNIEEVYLKLLSDNRMWFGADGNGVPRKKVFLSEKVGKSIWTWWTNSEVGHTQEATQALTTLLGSKTIFDYPKPVRLIKRMVELASKDDDIVLDFFSGSATTAHAVMQLNTEDKGNRKFIMVQLPEPTDTKSEANKKGYETITEIGKERIRRAGEKIIENNKDKEVIENLDTGFKVFKVEDTNFRRIREIENKNIDTKYKSLSEKDEEDFNPHFTDLDIVYELMLRRQDIELTEEIKKLDSIGDRTFIVGDTMLVCLEEKITEEIVEKIGKIDTDLSWIILRDSAFDDDCDLKINTTRKLRSIIKSSKKKDQKIYWI